MEGRVYKRKMAVDVAISNLQLYFDSYMYPRDLYTDSVETILWLLSSHNTGLSEAQEIYDEGFHNGYDKGYYEGLKGD